VDLNVWLLLGGVVVIAAAVSVRIVNRSGLPSLLIFLGLGVLLGEAGLAFDDADLAHQIGVAALALILAEGGLTTSWSHVRRAVPTALVLATVGVGISIAVMALALRGLLDMDWRTALLFGAVLASTDAAAVFSVLRRLPLPPRLGGMLEAESGFNDAPAVLVVVALSAANAPLPTVWDLVWYVLAELAVGAAVALVVGPLGAFALRRLALPASALHAIVVLSSTFVAYGGATLLHGSGFLAIYVTALILGNARLPHRAATRGFVEAAAWLAQIGLFVMLGMLASPAEMSSTVVPALLAGLVLLLVARPLSVGVCAALVRLLRLDRIGWREQAFLSWAGLRGAVPIVLATIPWAGDTAGAEHLFNEVFVLVFLFTLLQGPTLPFVARLLRVAAPAEAHELEVEAAPLEELHAELLQVRVPSASRLHGVEVFELRLPAEAQVTLIVRDGRGFVPGPYTRIHADDQLLVVTTGNCREAVERRLRAVSRRGKLAGWFGEQG